MGPRASDFRLQALPGAYLPCLAAILAVGAVLTTVMKRDDLLRFGWQ